jgi:hypothetical protein
MTLVLRGTTILFPVALFLWGMWSFPLALFGPDRNLVPGDLGDARLNNFVLEHFHAYISGRTPGYGDAPFLYPEKNTMARVDGLLGTAPIYALFRHAGSERETSFQLWSLALFGLDYWCCFLALLLWQKRPWSAACGAFLFAFGIYGVAWVGHAQTLPRFLMPVALYLLWQWLSTGGARYIVFVAIVAVAQFYCSLSLGTALLYGMLCLSVAHTLIHQREAAWRLLPTRQVILPLLASLLLAIALLAPLLLPHLHIADAPGTFPIADTATAHPTLVSLFRAPAAALSWQDLAPTDPDPSAQATLFMGAALWLPLLAIAVLLVRRRLPATDRRSMATIALAWCCAVALTVIPASFDLRATGGMVHLLATFMVMALALVAAWAERQGRWWAVSVALLLPCLLVVDGRLDPSRVERYDKHASRTAIAQVRKHLQRHAPLVRDALCYGPVLPVVEEHAREQALASAHLNAMLAAQELSLPIVNAYADRLPQEYAPLFDHPDRESLQRWCAVSGLDTARIQWEDNVGLPIRHIERVRLKAHDGRYVCTKADGYGALVVDHAPEERSQGTVLVHLADGHTGIMMHTGQWVWAELFKHGALLGDSPELGDLGLFTMQRDAAGRMAFRCADGRWVTPMEDGSLVAGPETLIPEAWFTPAPLPKGYR